MQTISITITDAGEKAINSMMRRQGLNVDLATAVQAQADANIAGIIAQQNQMDDQDLQNEINSATPDQIAAVAAILNPV